MNSINPFQSTRDQQTRHFDSYKRENSTGFDSIDIDLYSVMDVPNSSTQKQIEKQFRKISLHFHPDKLKRSNIANDEDDSRYQS
jgi:DnaJ-class molecular chaperone